jgi:CRP/FNR family transcriptional regulator, cyclic AMP receptor protein
MSEPCAPLTQTFCWLDATDFRGILTVSSTYKASASVTLEDAARLLASDSALGNFSLSDARYVLSYMQARRVAQDTVLINEGKQARSDFMVLILEGDVSIESEMPGTRESLVMNIVGAGHIIGEMSMFDEGPRAATCTAATGLAVAVMSRSALKRLLMERPEVGVRFLLAMSKRLSDRLRDANHKLRTYVALTNALQQEVHALLDGKSPASFSRKKAKI